MADVVRWIDEQESDEVVDALDTAGQWQALQALRATWGRDDRQRSAVYTTAETVVEVFADPAVAASTMPGPGDIDPLRLLDGANTLYLCAPAHEQRRLRPLFSGLVSRVIEAAYERAGRQGRPLDPPLLVVLDEAANVAPLTELDVLASTAAGHGIQLVTVWQDLAQLTARYGAEGGHGGEQPPGQALPGRHRRPRYPRARQHPYRRGRTGVGVDHRRSQPGGDVDHPGGDLPPVGTGRRDAADGTRLPAS